jgi:hypothetical protein
MEGSDLCVSVIILLDFCEKIGFTHFISAVHSLFVIVLDLRVPFLVKLGSLLGGRSDLVLRFEFLLLVQFSAANFHSPASFPALLCHPSSVRGTIAQHFYFRAPGAPSPLFRRSDCSCSTRWQIHGLQFMFGPRFGPDSFS